MTGKKLYEKLENAMIYLKLIGYDIVIVTAILMIYKEDKLVYTVYDLRRKYYIDNDRETLFELFTIEELNKKLIELL